MTPSETAKGLPESGARLKSVQEILLGKRFYFETLLLAGIYFVSGTLGLKLARVHGSATAIWPPTGIALGACLLIGWRAWPGIFAGALLANLATPAGGAASAGIAAGNTLEAMAGAFLVNRWAAGKEALGRPRDVFLFAFLAAILSTTVSATVGVATLWFAKSAPSSDLGSIWATWWLGDLGGDLIVAPAILAWRPRDRDRWPLRQLLEAVCLLGILLFVAWAVFGGRLGIFGQNYPVDFLCLPPVLWAAYRFGRRGAAAALLLLASVALQGTLHRGGPFARNAENETLLLLETFLGVTSVTAFVVAAAVEERRAAAEDLARKLQEVATLNAKLDEQKDEIETYHKLLTHDVTNFTSALLGFLQRLLLQVDGSLTEKQLELLRRSNRQALEINRMAVNARMLVQVRERGLTAPGEPVDVSGAVARAIQVVRDLHFDRGVDVSVDTPAAPLEVSGTPFLDNVLVNLLDNAVRHGSREGRPRVTLRIVRQGDRLHLWVRGGIPPPPERIRSLFEKGVQSPGFSAHGMGLVVIREIVERAGGTLLADAVSGPEGELFEVSLSLPVAPSAPSPGDRRTLDSQLPGGPLSERRGSAFTSEDPRRA